MLRIIRMFFGTKEANPYLVVLGLLLASLAETVGIGTLLPVIAIASGGEGGAQSPLGEIVASLLATVGLSRELGPLVLIVAGFMILKSALSFAAIAYATLAAAKVAMKLRRQLSRAVFSARWGYFSDQKSGTLANVMGNESSLAAESYIISANVVASTIQATAYTLIALAINPPLALIGVITGIVLTVTLQRFVTMSRKAGYKLTDNTSALANYLVDAMANIKAMKSMHRFEPTLLSISKIFIKLRRSFVTKEFAKAGLAHSGDAIVAVIAATGIYFASTYLEVPFPELIVSAIVFNQIVYVSARLQRLVQLAGRFESSYVRTVETIRDAEAQAEMNAGTAVPEIGAGCRFEEVSFAHGDRLILNAVSMEIPANAITVLSGSSGAGKTTIIDLLVGLHRPSAGRVLIGGVPIEDIDIALWRGQIGYVPQELSLFHTSVRANLTLGDDSVTDDRIVAALDQAGATEFVNAMAEGLSTDVGEMGSKLSGGQRQRISLARALVNRPKLLILDEVTSALDPATEAGIVANIAELRGRYTIVAITHRPAWTAIADRLYHVAEGRVTAGTPLPEAAT